MEGFEPPKPSVWLRHGPQQLSRSQQLNPDVDDVHIVIHCIVVCTVLKM